MIKTQSMMSRIPLCVAFTGNRYFQGAQLCQTHFCLPSERCLNKDFGVYSKRKEFAPTGSKFFPFIVNPFSE